MTIAEFVAPMVSTGKFKPTAAMSIYHQNGVDYQTPYFYIIQHVRAGKYYAGYKGGSNPDSRNLMQPDGYQTSSKIIGEIVKNEGLEAFVVRKIRHFQSGQDAFSYETKFLKRIGVPNNQVWYNRHVADEFSMIGNKHSPETKAKMSAAQKGRSKSAEHCMNLRGLKRSDETRAKISLVRTGTFLSAEHKSRIGEGLIGRVQSAETRAKIAASNKGKPHGGKGMRWITDGIVAKKSYTLESGFWFGKSRPKES